jgi:hypothetical protein
VLYIIYAVDLKDCLSRSGNVGPAVCSPSDAEVWPSWSLAKEDDCNVHFAW